MTLGPPTPGNVLQPADSRLLSRSEGGSRKGSCWPRGLEWLEVLKAWVGFTVSLVEMIIELADSVGYHSYSQMRWLCERETFQKLLHGKPSKNWCLNHDFHRKKITGNGTSELSTINHQPTIIINSTTPSNQQPSALPPFTGLPCHYAATRWDCPWPPCCSAPKSVQIQQKQLGYTNSSHVSDKDLGSIYWNWYVHIDILFSIVIICTDYYYYYHH